MGPPLPTKDGGALRIRTVTAAGPGATLHPLPVPVNRDGNALLLR